MRHFFNRIGGPDAFNWVSMLLFYPLVLVGTVVGSGVRFRSEVPTFLLASSLSVFAVWAVLILAKVSWLRKAQLKPVPIRTLLTIVVALLVRAWVFDTLLLAWNLEEQGRFVYRFTVSLGTMGVSLLVTTYLISLAREYSKRSRDLRLTIDALANARDDVDGKIEARRTELIAKIRSQLTSRLQAFREDSAGVTLDELRATIEDVVRPVSHELDRKVAEIGGKAPSTRDDRILWSRVLSNSTLGQPIRPLMFSVWSGLSALPIAPRIWGLWQGLAVSATVFVVPLLLLVVVRKFWSRLAMNREAKARAALFTGFLLVLSIITAILAGYISGLSDTLSGMIFPQTVLWTFSGWVVAIIPSLRTETQRVIDQLNTASMELREELVRVNTAYRLEQKAIARALHGPIQDAMSVGAFKLSAAIEAGKATPKLIAEIRETITDTLVLLETQETAKPNLQAALEDMAELWEGVVEISSNISAKAKTAIAKHAVTTASATELIREAVSNAVRHGAATEVSVSVEVKDDRLVILVANNGTQKINAKKKGLGTTLLDELALSWSREKVDGRTQLLATLPLI